ncbi:MAG: hypothetical protein KKH29_03705 [Candidatus Omnitrophica bacterium]|nr:hypothetical protein [Candidatus Omnitrophota bacterium]MCG2706797.1 hypothetical protein [Candidatus Omnitrophota bacterium]
MKEKEGSIVKNILALADKTIIANIDAVVAKVRKPIATKPGSRDKTRQSIVIEDDSGRVDVIIWGGDYKENIVGQRIGLRSAMVGSYKGRKRLTVFDKNIDINKYAKISRSSTLSEKQVPIEEKDSQDYIAKDKIIFDLSKLLVKCFDAVYKELKKEKYVDVPVQEVEKMGATIFLTIKEMLFAKWGRNAPAKDLEDLI